MMRVLRALSRHPDIRALVPLLVLCGVAASVYLFGFTGRVTQGYGPEAEWFTPAILWATGHGLFTPVPEGIPGLPAFMLGTSDHLDLGQVPAAPPTWELSPFCQTHRYLLYAVGLVWSVFGVSWHTIKLVPLGAYLLAVALLYGLFRLACGRRIAWAGVAFVMLSPPVLAMLPSVRDFCKTPFFFAIFLLLGLLVKGGLSRRNYLLCAAGLGALCGMGIGFRQDFLACMAPCVAAVLFAPPFRSGPSWRMRLAGAALCIGSLLLSGWPILGAIQRENGAVSSHSLAQGLSTEAETRLGIGGASYELLESTNDNLVHATIHAYDRRAGHHEAMDNYLSPAYGDAGRRFFRAVVLTFPYDLSLRAFAAVYASFAILTEAPRDLATSASFQNAFIARLNQAYAGPAWLVSSLGLTAACLSLLSLLCLRPHAGLALLAALLFFTGYTSVLFQYRHAFHLAFVSPFFLALACSGILHRRTLLPLLRERVALQRGALAAGGVVLLAAFSLLLLHTVQGYRVQSLASAYADAPLRKLETTSETESQGIRLRPVQDVTGGRTSPPKGIMDVSTAYLAVRWKSLPPGLRVEALYDTASAGNDFTRSVSPPPHLASHTGPVTWYFPVYETATAKPREPGGEAVYAPLEYVRAQFGGIRVRPDDLPHLDGLYQVEQTEAFPFFLYFWWTPEAEGLRLHKGWLASP